MKKLLPGFTAFLLVFSLMSPISYYNRVPKPDTHLPLTISDIMENASAPVLAKSHPVPETLRTVNGFDYFADSVSNLSTESYTDEEIEDLMEKYGKFTGPPGMPVDEYRAAMQQPWNDATVYKKKVRNIEIDVSRSYKYSKIISLLKILSHREGVHLFDIGSTTSGRRMYALEIDVPSDNEKKTVVLTGSIHARETAGSTFLLKEITDLLQAETEEAQEVLENIRFAVIVCCNPDGREGVAFDTENYTYSGGQLWKATSNGTDLNRNFPGLSWSQVRTGYTKSRNIGKSADKLYYPGDHGGSCSETKAIMKFLYHYIVHEQAVAIIDYHQQGRISYAGKSWLTDEHHDHCVDLANAMLKTLNSGNKHKYYVEKDNEESGQEGEGSTLTDFALSVALGAKYSPGYGFFVFTDGKKEYPLITVNRLEGTKNNILDSANYIAQMTFEIGYGSSYLGYSKETRKLLKKEYENYHFDRVLYTLYDFLKE